MSRKKHHSRSDRERTLLHYARKHLGKPYKYGARPWQAPRVFDCSSFVQYLYRRIGIQLPRISIAQAEKGRPVRLAALLAGDLIFTRGGMGRYNKKFPKGIGHVALYAGDGTVIHAEGIRYRKVIEEPLKEFLRKSNVTVVKRYF